VARFLASLHDMDGVTRVSVLTSDEPDSSATNGSSPAPAGGDTASTSCAARDFISTFEVIAAFDTAQPAATAAPSTSPSPTATPGPSTPTASTTSTASAADQSQVADGQQQLQQQKDSAAQQTNKAHKDVHTLVPGTGTAP
jgi:hypothetical protein